MSAPDDSVRQAIVDQEHLKVLSIAYLVSAIWSALMSLLGLGYAAMGIAFGQMLLRSPARAGAEPPEFVGWIFALFGFGMFAILITIGLLKFFAYRNLKQRRGRIFCMVIAGISCLSIPYGTLLGVFTFLVLSRPSIVSLFKPDLPILPPDAGAPS